MSIFKADHLAEWSGGIWKRKPNNSIYGFSIDSRMVQSGDLFVAVKAARNGHDFISVLREMVPMVLWVRNISLMFQFHS